MATHNVAVGAQAAADEQATGRQSAAQRTASAEERAGTIDEVVLTQLMRLNAMATGFTTGILAGLMVLVATNWLVLKGGPVVGPHLALLGQFFIGYRVTFVGSLIGFAYAFLLGMLVGYAIAALYNWFVDLRASISQRGAAR
jgi:hypothetical protein